MSTTESLLAAFAERLGSNVRRSKHHDELLEIEDDEYAYPESLLAHAAAVAEDLAADGSDVGFMLAHGEVFTVEWARGAAAPTVAKVSSVMAVSQ